MRIVRNVSISLILGLALAGQALGTPVLNGTYSQDFNGMNTGTTYPDGWAAYSISGTHDQFKPVDDPAGTGAPPTGAGIKGGTSVSMTAATPGSQKAATGFNWAVGGSSTERSLGTSPTGIAGMALQLTLGNDSANAINQISVQYDIRRFSVTTNNNNYNNPPYTGLEELPGYWLFYSLDGGNTFTNVDALNPTIANVPNAIGTTNIPATTITLSGPWNPGQSIMFRWFDDNAQGPSPDQLIGLDNLNISAVPEPATLVLLGLGGGLAILRKRNRR